MTRNFEGIVTPKTLVFIDVFGIGDEVTRILCKVIKNIYREHVALALLLYILFSAIYAISSSPRHHTPKTLVFIDILG